MTDRAGSRCVGVDSDDELRSTRAAHAATIALAAAVAIGVCLPFVAKGWLFLLDWQRGPHVPLPRELWGLDGGPPAGVPFALAAWALGRVLDPSIVAWLPIVVALFVAGVAAGRLVGGSTSRRLPAALLYTVNPFVYDRLYAGHVSFLLAYALLPVAVASLLAASRADRRSARLRPVLWITLLVALSPHLAWLMAAVCLVVLATSPDRRTAGWLAGLAVAVVLANAYLVLPSLRGEPAVEVGTADLVAYRTSGDSTLALLGNVAGLHGFWRQEIPLPRDDVPGWPLFQGAIVVVGAAGAVRGWRRAEDRRLVAVAAGVGAVGFVLALGDQGPVGSAYRWLFVHVPGFEVMREPQKFAALLALAYAVLFGLGAQALVAGVRGRGRAFWTAAALALPVAATPTLFWGLAGRVEVTRYPSSWEEADHLMGDGPERVLFLPWHQYLSFPFTGRVVANPAHFAFRRDVIAGDNVELPGLRSASRVTRSAYLEFLYAHGQELRTFGQLVAPHGVKYVVVSKAVDWRDYTWLDRQVDLEKVLDRPEISVYRNARTVSLGTRDLGATTVDDWGEVVGLSETADLSGTAVRARHQGPGRIRAPSARAAPLPPGARARVERLSPVRYRVAKGLGGWLALGEPFDRSWRLDGRRPVPLAGGVVGFPVGPDGSEIRFGHWSLLRLGYAISGAVLGCVAIGSVRRERTKE